MAKKYLSLEEAASLLGMSVDAVRRAREKGDLRGFQDRGSWKFREQDIDEFRRSQQADSSPDMPMLSADGGLDLSSSDSDVRLMADPADDDLGDLVNSGSDGFGVGRIIVECQHTGAGADAVVVVKPRQFKFAFAASNL